MLCMLRAIYNNIFYLFQIIIHIFINKYYFVVISPKFFYLYRPSSGRTVI